MSSVLCSFTSIPTQRRQILALALFYAANNYNSSSGRSTKIKAGGGQLLHLHVVQFLNSLNMSSSHFCFVSRKKIHDAV